MMNFKVGDRVAFKKRGPDDPELLKIVAIYESRNIVMLKGIDKPWKGGTGIDSIKEASPKKSRPKKRRSKREKPEDYWP